MTEQTPATEAGRRLIERHADAAVYCGTNDAVLAADILAIEAEARAAEPAGLDEAVLRGEYEKIIANIQREAIEEITRLHRLLAAEPAGLDFAIVYRIFLGMPLGLTVRKRAEYIVAEYARLAYEEGT